MLSACWLSGCAVQEKGTNRQNVRLTFYHPGEDKYGSKTVTGRRAHQGITCAAEQAYALGTRIYIPVLRDIIGSSDYIVQDRGTAVQGRKASHGLLPVIDVFVERKTWRYVKRLPALITEAVVQ
jgi:3D (Asp-Asp-Asp) domain-containing protein